MMETVAIHIEKRTSFIQKLDDLVGLADRKRILPKARILACNQFGQLQCCKSIRACVMRVTVGQLIDEFARDEKLHILEVATFFGATQAYIERGYQEYLCINSFPSESFTENEAEAFDTYFGNQKGKRIIEILEYPKVSLREWVRKSEMVQNKHWKVSLDDFGMGENNMNAVYLYTPDIVKLDRSLICGIDNDARKQENVRTYLESFHERGMQVLAEGVETREECDFLRSLGVDLFQGYYLAMPA